MSLFVVAYAQAAPVASNAPKFDFMSMIPIFLILGVGYFLMIRPQQKKMKQHADMISAIRRGDRVMTSSGMIGVIHKIASNEEVILEIAENVRVRMLKSSISQVLAKTAPVDVHTIDNDVYNADESLLNEPVNNINTEIVRTKKNTKMPVRPKKLPIRSE